MSPVTAEEEFGLALSAVRGTYGPQSVAEDELREIVATEENRVADAAVIAELLASRLAGQKPAPSALSDTPPRTLSTPIPFPSPPAGGSQTTIADLIDGMLSQEKRDTRKSARA